MLGEHPITPVLLAKDLAAAREFYHDQLGLEILTESEAAIVFQGGGGTHLDITRSATGTANLRTAATATSLLRCGRIELPTTAPTAWARTAATCRPAGLLGP